MLRSTGWCLCLCLVALVIGILIGGSLEAPVPHNNETYLQVMPYGDVNVIGSPGDKIEWRTPGSSNLPAINFLGDTPCGPISNPCTIKSNIGNGIYLYGCSGNASCPDPGVGPISTTAPLTLFGKFLKVFDAVVVDIAHSLDFFEASGFRMVLSSTNGSSNEAAKPAVARPAYRTSAEITCSGNTTIAPTVQVNSNGSILWASSNDNFTIAIVADKPICKENLSTPNIWQLCTLTGVASGQSYPYTATVDKCSESTPPSKIIVQ